jgi:hypothetical protein
MSRSCEQTPLFLKGRFLMTTATIDKAQDKSATEQAQDNRALAPLGKAAGLQTLDDSDFANLLDTKRFEHMWRVASLFAKSAMVPEHYRGQPESCFIACQMAVRLRVDPFMFMQNTYVVHGRPGMEAKLAIALINSSGLFTDSLDYEIVGKDPAAPDYRVRAYAVRKTTGKRIEGPWIDWRTVKSEGWDSKGGSKWKTMPGLMFQYRAAAWFGRLHCPERLMGMQTADELEDVATTRYIESTSIAPGESKAVALAERLDVQTGEVTQEQRTPSVATTDAQATATAAGQPSDDERRAIRFGEVAQVLADQHGVPLAAAQQRLGEFSGKVYKTLPDKLTDEQLADLATKVNNGDVTMPKKGK